MLERLRLHIARPTIANERLALTGRVNVRYRLKAPHRDRITHMVFEPLNFTARLAAIVPKPRLNHTRFHGPFALMSLQPQLGSDVLVGYFWGCR